MAACVGASVCKLTIYINKRGAWGYDIESLRNITMKIQLTNSENIDAWMALVEQVRDAFPGLETAEAMAEHRATVLQFIQESSAICALEAGRVAGALLFSR